MSCSGSTAPSAPRRSLLGTETGTESESESHSECELPEPRGELNETATLTVRCRCRGPKRNFRQRRQPYPTELARNENRA
ncbi:GD19456 [Drosophila simulans]|uniref:GD19456 n=1 Tax=Drosophila simulans TaxID=7240 RepID=B4R0A3_DROSI|nr:GD19456 [Drosophila simulans]